MQEIQIERNTAVNAERLNEDLQTVPGYLGCSTAPGKVRVFFEGDVDISTIQAIVANHDEAGLSTRESQQEALRSEINTLKISVGDIDTLTEADAVNAIKFLYKVLKLNELI